MQREIEAVTAVHRLEWPPGWYQDSRSFRMKNVCASLGGVPSIMYHHQCMRPLWQLCLSELLQDVIIYCIMPAARSPELFMFDSIMIMSSWIVQLAVFTALFCVVCRREMLDTPVNMDNACSVTPALTHLRSCATAGWTW